MSPRQVALIASQRIWCAAVMQPRLTEAHLLEAAKRADQAYLEVLELETWLRLKPVDDARPACR